MQLARATGIFLILVVPLFIIIVVFMPLASHHKQDRYVEYVVPRNFAKVDLVKLVGHMRQDPEFGFYFQSLPEETLNMAIEEIYSQLDQNRGKDKHLELLDSTQENIRSLAILFENFHYSQDIQQFSQLTPELTRAVWLFFCEEFKLVVIGLCYRVTYDRDFSFQWDDEIKRIAMDIRHIIQDLRRNNSWPLEISFPVDSAMAKK